eukprot:COSAG04_NODE_731_length_10733_cov_3.264435_10_plen_489_part_00
MVSHLHPMLLASALLLLLAHAGAPEADDVAARLELLRRLADASPTAEQGGVPGGVQAATQQPARRRPGGDSPSSDHAGLVQSRARQLARQWRKRAMPEASQAAVGLGEALVLLAGTERSAESRATLEAVAGHYKEYSAYLLYSGMEDGTHADWPRLLDALFHLAWTLAELGPRVGASGRAVLVRPADLRSVAKAMVSTAAEGRGDTLTPEHLLLARYAVAHTALADGKLELAEASIQAAEAAISAEEQAAADASPGRRLVLTSVHILYAHLLLRRGEGEAAAARCAALAATDGDFNIVYRCALPLLPLPLPAAASFSLDQLHSMLSSIRDETIHGRSSVTNLHLADIEQWRSFGSQQESLLPRGVEEAGLDCDARASAVVSARRLAAPRLLVVIPAVASEGARLRENLQLWGRRHHFPCREPSQPDGEGGRADVMLLFSRSPAEAPDWLRPPEHAMRGLLGEAAECFGEAFVRYANLSAAEEFYEGAW